MVQLNKNQSLFWYLYKKKTRVRNNDLYLTKLSLIGNFRGIIWCHSLSFIALNGHHQFVTSVILYNIINTGCHCRPWVPERGFNAKCHTWSGKLPNVTSIQQFSIRCWHKKALESQTHFSLRTALLLLHSLGLTTATCE